MTSFRKTDLIQFEKKGISVNTIEQQLKNFRNGFPYTRLLKPATIGDGIELLSQAETSSLSRNYETNSGEFTNYKICTRFRRCKSYV